MKNKKAKFLLENITFDHEGAHLAYTLGSGAASKKNKAFLFKGEDELDIENLDEESLSLLEKAMKKEGNENLSASAFAYVPDKEKPSTWKLRIDDARHVAGAVAALGKGMMGNKVEIPAKDLAAVKSKVRSAYKKFYPDKDTPDVLKSVDDNESGLMLDSDNNANSGINKEENKMTDKTFTEEELQKAAKVLAEQQANEILKAKEKEMEAAILKKFEAEQAEKELTKSTTELVKSYEFLGENVSVEDIVKSVVEHESNVILDVLKAADEAIEKAKQETKAKTEELEKFKEDFTNHETVRGDVDSNEGLSHKEKLAKAVKFTQEQRAKAKA